MSLQLQFNAIATVVHLSMCGLWVSYNRERLNSLNLLER